MEVEVGTQNASVFWTPPTATDTSGATSLLSHTHHPGNILSVEETTAVEYVFSDSSDNRKSCHFDIEFKKGKSEKKVC